MHLILKVLDPVDRFTISIPEFASIIRFASDLTSVSPQTLSGSEVASSLFLHGFKDKEFSVAAQRSRVSSRVGTGIGISLPLPPSRPSTGLPASLCLSRSVILNILGCVCTSYESEKKLSVLLHPFFDKNSTHNNKMKSGRSSVSTGDSHSTGVTDDFNNLKTSSVLTDERDVRAHTTLPVQGSDRLEKTVVVAVESQSKRIADLLKIMTADALRNIPTVVEECSETSERTSDDSTNAPPIGESVSTSDKSIGTYEEIHDDTNDMHHDGLRQREEGEVVSGRRRNHSMDFDSYSVEHVCMYVHQCPLLQSLLECEVRSVMYQLVTSSTKYYTEAKLLRT